MISSRRDEGGWVKDMIDTIDGLQHILVVSQVSPDDPYPLLAFPLLEFFPFLLGI